MKVSICKFFQILSVIVSFSFFIGCASTIPMQQSIVTQMGGDTTLSQYQYYVSRDIVLTVESEYGEQKISQSGTAQIKSQVVRDSIQITSSTAGVVPFSVVSYSYDETSKRLILGIAFESSDNDRLWFIQDAATPGSRFHLLYDDPVASIIKYGEAYYKVTYDYSGGIAASTKAGFNSMMGKMKGTFQGTNVKSAEDESPYLLIKIKNNQKVKDNLRTAKGRKV